MPGTTATNNELAVQTAVIENAQITLAYFATGRSNIHVLIEQLQQLSLQPASSNLAWSVDTIELRNVTVNLFDNEKPLASVTLAELILPRIDSTRSSEQQIRTLLWPVVEQIVAQAMAGEGTNSAVDVSGLTRFLWRETMN